MNSASVCKLMSKIPYLEFLDNGGGASSDSAKHQKTSLMKTTHHQMQSGGQTLAANALMLHLLG